VNLHQYSSTTYDLYALGFTKSLLQACLCQHFVSSLQPTPLLEVKQQHSFSELKHI